MQHKKDKKTNICFRTPFFDTSTTFGKKTFSHPYTLFAFFLILPKHYKIGEKLAKTNLGQIFDSTLARFLTQDRPNLGQIFDSTACILKHNIYIYVSPGTSAAHILGKCSTCRVWGLDLQIGVETSHTHNNSL